MDDILLVDSDADTLVQRSKKKNCLIWNYEFIPEKPQGDSINSIKDIV